MSEKVAVEKDLVRDGWVRGEDREGYLHKHTGTRPCYITPYPHLNTQTHTHTHTQTDRYRGILHNTNIHTNTRVYK